MKAIITLYLTALVYVHGAFLPQTVKATDSSGEIREDVPVTATDSIYPEDSSTILAPSSVSGSGLVSGSRSPGAPLLQTVKATDSFMGDVPVTGIVSIYPEGSGSISAPSSVSGSQSSGVTFALSGAVAAVGFILNGGKQGSYPVSESASAMGSGSGHASSSGSG